MNQRFESIYRIAFIIICATGIFIHFDWNNGDTNAHEFSYFTLWSNIFCLVFMIVLLIKHFAGKNTRSSALIYFKGMATVSIICTFLVYHFSDHKIITLENMIFLGLPVESILAHYVVPFMFVLDWLIFQPKGLFQWKYIFTWLAFPLTYILCFFTRCRCNTPESFINVPKYPYFFLNYECIGYEKCFLYILVLSMIFLSANILVVFTDKLIHKWINTKKRRD